VRWRLTAALAILFLVVGGYGAWAYVRNYDLYRGFPPPKDPPGVVAGSLVPQSFYSPVLGRRDSYFVYEPPGYAKMAAAGRRLPVLYLLHGSNSNGETYLNVGRAGVALDELLASHSVRPFLIVIPESTNGTLTDDTEWANGSDGKFESEFVQIVRQVDAHWPTISKRNGRALAGLSMGGYGALNIGLHHPGMFSTLESWSGYFTQTRSGPFGNASRANLDLNSPAAYAPSIASRLQRRPMHVLIYTGRTDPLVREQAAFAAELQRLGVKVTTAQPTGEHDWALWRREMPMSLLYAAHQFEHAKVAR
jgi:enterochelin esterase-like enzyme